jgi:PLAT/LH2 domain
MSVAHNEAARETALESNNSLKLCSVKTQQNGENIMSTQSTKKVSKVASKKLFRRYTFERLTAALASDTRIVGVVVTIQTGNIEWAGTDADVSLSIGGHDFPLDKPGYDDFERGDVDSYYFRTELTLDQLRNDQITLQHDNARGNPGWYVSSVVLQIQQPNQRNLLTYKRWASIGWLADDEFPNNRQVELQHGTEI